MPELPEVETTRQGIAPIIGLTITDIWQSALPCANHSHPIKRNNFINNKF
ncbi:DNA-formamidopyrimidine glycosylase family protein [Rappaport israeli]